MKDPQIGKKKERVRERISARALLNDFDRLHRQYVGASAIVTKGKDHVLLRMIAESQGVTMTRDLMRDYFTSDDPWIKAHGYGVGVFVTQASSLLARRMRAAKRMIARDWRVECAELHDGRCPNVHFHQAQKEATK